MAATRYRANTPRIVDETIDGETLIIDMVTGTYFSCAGPSTLAWTALCRGATADETAQLICSTYGIAASDAKRDAEQFLAMLVGDELLVLREEDADSASVIEEAELDSCGGGYELLHIDKYTGLADLILLDPVHDVSVAGWPSGPE